MQQFWAQYWWTIVIFFLLFGTFFTVNQGFIAVITMFGKYQRIARPGLRLKIPFIETIHKRVSIQNRSVELEFQAVTQDQANVYFKSMLLYSVQNEDEETIKKVAFKFIADRDLMQALIRTIEGNIRSFVATKKQAEVLGLRREIVSYVKDEVDHSLESSDIKDYKSNSLWRLTLLRLFKQRSAIVGGIILLLLILLLHPFLLNPS